MSKTQKRMKPQADPFAAVSLELPGMPALGDAMDDLPDLDDALNRPQTIMEQLEENGMFGDSNEQNTKMVNEVIHNEFAAIHEGRKQQQDAIELANDTEYWFAVYFQSREQKEAFLKAVDWFQRGDKYLDGRFVAEKMGVTLPPREAPYKVGKLDKKLTDLT